MSLAVANQYAKALMESVAQPASGLAAEAALGQLDQFAAALQESHELRTVLLSPAVAPAQKQKIIGRIGGAMELHGLVRNFIVVVTRHRRLDILNEIRLRFQALLDESASLVRAQVATAQPLSDGQKTNLEQTLARLTGKSVRCGYEVEAALLGGVSVRIGSTMYDGSVRGQFEGLRRRLSE